MQADINGLFTFPFKKTIRAKQNHCQPWQRLEQGLPETLKHKLRSGLDCLSHREPDLPSRQRFPALVMRTHLGIAGTTVQLHKDREKLTVGFADKMRPPLGFIRWAKYANHARNPDSRRDVDGAGIHREKKLRTFVQGNSFP